MKNIVTRSRSLVYIRVFESYQCGSGLGFCRGEGISPTAKTGHINTNEDMQYVIQDALCKMWATL